MRSVWHSRPRLWMLLAVWHSGPPLWMLLAVWHSGPPLWMIHSRGRLCHTDFILLKCYLTHSLGWSITLPDWPLSKSR